MSNIIFIIEGEEEDEQYQYKIYKNKLYLHNDDIDIEDGYTNFDVKIVIYNDTKIALLEVKVTGTTHHYTCGSYNTDMEELNVSFTHKCKSTNEFNEVLNYLKTNKSEINQEFKNTDLEGYVGTIIKHIEKKIPEFDDVYKMQIVNKNIPDNFDSKCDITFDFDLNIYDNEMLLLSVKLIGNLEYDKDDDTYCQDSKCELLYKYDDIKINNKTIKYLEKNFTLLNDQISNHIIEQFKDDFITDLYYFVGCNYYNEYDSDSNNDF